MKKIITCIFFSLTVIVMYAQEATIIRPSGETSQFGYVSIGPENEFNSADFILLDIYQPLGNVSSRIGTSLGVLNFNIAGHNGAFSPIAKSGNVVITKHTTDKVIFNLNNTADDGNHAFIFGDNKNTRTFNILNNGKVGIGTGDDTLNCSNCTGYNLFVKEGIKTEKVKVVIASADGWADYVFRKDYKLRSLEALELYINKNNHLPEVPSATDVVENGGVELKEMTVLLLKKIEELTLYTIQQQKMIEKLQDEVKLSKQEKK